MRVPAVVAAVLFVWQASGTTVLVAADPPSPCMNSSTAWGNAVYVNLTIGDSLPYLDKSVTLLSVTNNIATVSVDGETRKLTMARLMLPTVINGVRVFVADTRPVASLTTDEKHPLVHAALTGDALLCLSDPARPLLAPERFTFPVARDDGFRWSMGKNSHMFAYLRPQRSHEGIDIDLTEARGKEIHALVAVEDGIVRWVEHGQPPEACLLLESASQPGLYYIYQHLNRDKLFVRAGQAVKRGERLAYIWGDWRWGHHVRAEVGDYHAATWQQIEFEAIDAGTFELPRGELAWTEDKRVTVCDGRLTVRIRLRDGRTPAGLQNLVFEKTP